MEPQNKASSIPFWVPILFAWLYLVFAVTRNFHTVVVQPFTYPYLITSHFLPKLFLVYFLYQAYRSNRHDRKMIVTIFILLTIDVLQTVFSIGDEVGRTSKEVVAVIEGWPPAKFILQLNVLGLSYESVYFFIGWTCFKLKPLYLMQKELDPFQTLLSKFVGVLWMGWAVFDFGQLLLYALLVHKI